MKDKVKPKKVIARSKKLIPVADDEIDEQSKKRLSPVQRSLCMWLIVESLLG